MESPDEPADEPRFQDGLLLRPELQASVGEKSRRITVLVRNVSERKITLTRRMPTAHLFPVKVVSVHPEKEYSDV